MAKQLVLKAKLDTSSAGQLRDDLVAADGQNLVMDGADVEHLGALCTEVLLSIRHLWAQKQHAVSIENPSTQMIDNLGQMGLSLDDLVTGVAP
jgi:chemotaxis protein CheX